ncbi:hypothetical protein WISP_43898 [Willisornis vidua]|uniref:Vitellogenin n=1 Tax=Willisornis vidua TaxID=1566151 RepID=A0ABQ9DFY5_9PASS|nr:hypothetical protein WISP_43898 [Willisornis vidua]
MPAGFKMDLPLAKAKPISDSTSGITNLRSGKIVVQQQPEREYVKVIALQTPSYYSHEHHKKTGTGQTACHLTEKCPKIDEEGS